MVPDAAVRVSRVAVRAHRRCSTVFRPDSARSAQRAMAASACLVLRAHHVLQRDGAHAIYHPGAHGGVGDVLASRARILFFATPAYWVGVADHAAAEDGSGCPPGCLRALSPFYTTSLRFSIANGRRNTAESIDHEPQAHSSRFTGVDSRVAGDVFRAPPGAASEKILSLAQR